MNSCKNTQSRLSASEDNLVQISAIQIDVHFAFTPLRVDDNAFHEWTNYLKQTALKRDLKKYLFLLDH